MILIKCYRYLGNCLKIIIDVQPVCIPQVLFLRACFDAGISVGLHVTKKILS